MNSSSLKVDIVGVKVIHGVTIPLQSIASVLYKDEMRVNITSFVHWCQVCQGAKAHYFCSTENTWVCVSCNGFCFNKAHDWMETSCGTFR